MIREEKYQHALYALHRIFVQGRFMAFRKEPHDDLARLFDYAEIMPELIASENDKTADFIKSLEGIAESFPQLRGILAQFNSQSTPFEGDQ